MNDMRGGGDKHPRGANKKPTMVDVAALAGVSTMTVSRALKPNSLVKAETRKKIQEAAESLGYVLDSTAAGLSSRRTGFVAATIPSINNANFADTLRGLTDGLEDSGLQILLGYTDYDKTKEERLVEQFMRRRPEAIVVTGGSHTDRCRQLLEQSGVPVLELWDRPQRPIGSVVGFSNAEAGRLMVRHFFEQGYRRMGFIGGDTSRDTRGLDRRIGFVDELRALGLDDSRVLSCGVPPITVYQGGLALREFVDKWPDTEAVMCVSDLSAFGAVMECHRSGLRVPEDIAVAGFGAFDVSEYCVPAITTIDVSARKIGEFAAESIERLLSPSDGRAKNTILEIRPELIVRESTLRGAL